MRPVPYAAPTGVAPDATARARNRAGDADLVVPPTVHLHGGPEGEVSAELSAGRIQWVDGLNACTVRNLSARLFSAKPEVGGRLIRLGCLFSPAARAGFLGDTFDGVGLPSGDGRSPAQAKADRGSFEAIVHLANYCAAFRLDVECTRAVVEQALHVAEKGNHHLVKSVLSGVRNDYQKHSVSATHGGKKTTMATYAGYIKRFCAWGVAGERVGTRLVPLSRHTVVLFLEAEAKRRLVRRAAPRRGAGMADEADSDDGDEDAEDEGDGAGVGPSNDAAAVGDGGADDGPPPKRLQRGFGAPASTTPNARTEANRRAAAASLVGRGVTGGTGGGGGTWARIGGEIWRPPLPASHAGVRAASMAGQPGRESISVAATTAPRGQAPPAAANSAADGAGTGAPRQLGQPPLPVGSARHGRAAAAVPVTGAFPAASGGCTPASEMAARTRAPRRPSSPPPPSSGRRTVTAGAGSSRPQGRPSTPRQGVPPRAGGGAGQAAPGRAAAAGTSVAERAGSGVAASVAREPGRLVSHHSLQGCLNALAKVSHLLNPLWRTATCACCRQWGVDEYLSGGSFYAATAVVGRRKRDRMLQETSAGTAKAKGKRKPTVSDEQRRRVAKALLETVGSQEFQKLSRINAVYTLQFALEARGATARDLGLSDVAVHTFPGLFSAGGKDLEVLCFYISATKTTDGVVRCIGALPHVDAWLCPVGAFADGLYALCHRPGGDSSAPPGDFRPVFRPDDEELLAAGVRPAHFREAGTDVGWRVWYRWLLFPAPNGGILKAMSYRYHNDAMRPVLMAQGVPDWAAKTHLMRKAAAQAGRQRGASEADSREHGIWTPGIGGGVYDGTLPNAPMTLALSGRPADCAAPSTPRLAVPVPEELQASFLPWLEDEEQSLAQRVAADPRAEDEALKDFFKVARWMRSVYFQTWAARLATASTPTHSYLKHHPLLRVPAFQSYCKTMAEALKAAGDVAANAVDEALPALSAAVGHAVQTVATATAVELGALEKRLSERTADDVAAVKQHVDAGVARVVAHGDAAAQDTRGHVDARFDALEATQRRQWELLARCLNDGVVKDPRARALLREELARAPPPHPQSAAGGLARSATVPLAQHTPAPPARASARLQADREHVRSLQAQGLLAGVPIHQTPDEAVPLLCMGTGLTWELALDEYAVGINGQVAIRVLDERFGNRWRLRQEGEAKRRHIKLYSERAALYRAFDVEYLRRGHSVGIDGVLAWLKSKYRAAKNTKEVLTLLRKDYPSGGGTA